MMYASACTASVDRNRPYCIFKQKTEAHANWLLPASCSHSRSSCVSLANMRKLHSICHVSFIYLVLPRLSKNLFMLVLRGPMFLQRLRPLFILHDRFYLFDTVPVVGVDIETVRATYDKHDWTADLRVVQFRAIFFQTAKKGDKFSMYVLRTTPRDELQLCMFIQLPQF